MNFDKREGCEGLNNGGADGARCEASSSSLLFFFSTTLLLGSEIPEAQNGKGNESGSFDTEFFKFTLC